MTANIESNLKEILNKLERKIDNLQGDLSGLRQQDIPTINVKVENLSTRMSQVEKTVDKVSTNQETIQKDVRLYNKVGNFRKNNNKVGN